MPLEEDFLLVDIGNSNTVTARYNGKKIIDKKLFKTSSFAKIVKEIESSLVDQIIISSVVPELDHELAHLTQCSFIHSQTIPSLKINVPIPQQVGADRLVTALAAVNKFRETCLVIDSGTAVTLCFVTKEFVYEGGIIFPGMRISSRALNLYTSKIPLIEGGVTDQLIGKTTKEAVEIGLYKGYIHLLNGFIKDFKSRKGPIKVVGTGNGLNLIKDSLALDAYEPDLIFDGLAYCATYSNVGSNRED